MPRALSAQQAKVLTKRRYTTATRVRVKDSTGTFQDLRSFLGKNWVARVSYATDIDDQTASATVDLFRDKNALSLAPLVETSKANLLTGSYAPLIDAMREIIIETAPMPEGVAVASGDWLEVFRGFIDRPSWGGKNKNSLTLECRDLAAPLAEIVLEKEGRADGSRYGLDPTGRPLEEVMQDVLDDWATPAGYTIVLYTPTGTLVDPRPIAERSGWNIKAWPNVAKGQSVMDALKALAGFIGYDVRVRWSSVTNTHRLELFNPPRSNTTPDLTIGPGAIRDIERLEIDAASVRNAVVVTYQTNPDDEETRTSTPTATDATSIARYRRRWMEVCPAGSAAIDTASEAEELRDAILSDLKDPKAEMIVESNYRPDLVLNDLVRWSPDRVHFTANQDLACVGLRHRIEPDGKATTQIASRGRPCGQFLSWLQIAAAPGRGAWTKSDAGPAPSVSVAATVGGLTASVSSNIVDRDLLHFEYHVSTSSGFTPDRSAVSTTRVARGQMTRVEVQNLTPGTTYYVKVLVVRRDGVVSAASTQQLTVPVKLGNALLDKLDYLELKDMDASPVADRRARVVDGVFQFTDTSNNETAGVVAVKEPILKDSTSTAHRKLKVASGKLSTTDVAGAAVSAVWESQFKLEKPVAMTPPNSDGNFYSFVWDCASTNLIVNPSFENNVSDGWTAEVGTTLTQDATTFVWGSKSAKLVSTGSTGMMSNSSATGGSGTERWAAAAWVRANSGTLPIGIVLQGWNGSSWVAVSRVTILNTIGTGWTRIATTGDVNAATYSLVRVYITCLGAGTYFADGVQLENFGTGAPSGRVPSTYIDGTLGPGYAWTNPAQPHNSTSTREAGCHPVSSINAAENLGGMVLYDNGAMRMGDILEVGSEDGRVRLDGLSKDTGSSSVIVEAVGVLANLNLLLKAKGAGIVKLGKVPSFKLTKPSSAQNEFTQDGGTITKITWDTEAIASIGGTFDNTNDRWTVATGSGGRWKLGATVAFDNITVGRNIQLFIYKNGVEIAEFTQPDTDGAPSVNRMSASVETIADLADNDYVEVFCRAGDGTWDVQVSGVATWFYGHRICD